MVKTTRQNRLPVQVGVGFKPQHLSRIALDSNGVNWFEVHAENYMVDGGPQKAMLEELAKDFPISCHGVGLSIGGPEPLDTAHLDRLKTLLNWLNPAMFSEHLAWSTHDQVFYNDLLPLPYTNAVLSHVIDHVNQVQDTLNRQILIENPSTYVHFTDHEMSEAEFISAIITKTGCGLLLDINNVYISTQNQNTNAWDYLDGLPMDQVGEIHLGGHIVDEDENGLPLLIDSHSAHVAAAVWQLYRDVIDTHGAKPTLIEWDNDVPEWHILQKEAVKAGLILDQRYRNHRKYKRQQGGQHDQHALA